MKKQKQNVVFNYYSNIKPVHYNQVDEYRLKFYDSKKSYYDESVKEYLKSN